MKLIIAYIKPERLNAVKQELYKRNVFKMSVSNALGCGQQKGYVEAYIPPGRSFCKSISGQNIPFETFLFSRGAE